MRLTLLFLFTCLQLIVFVQAQNISGVVNRYYKVSNISSTEVFTLNSVDGLNDFDKVIIIQMKGATVSTSTNDPSKPYGSISNLNNAGNYEVATICKVNTSNNTVALVHKLLNTNGYDVSAKVQMVKIARYEEAIVTDSLKAAPWSNVADTGGVLAVMAGDLTLNAPISADGKGYRGGKYLRTNGGYCLDNAFPLYYYDPTPYTQTWLWNSYPNTQAGAFKGESIYDPVSGHQGGKGAMATGGGGGNNHNTAGGGGSNIGAGGKGGENNTTSACKSYHPGIGGYALSSSNTKLFMGGGGGAGHGDNTPETGGGGGNGGGIIFVIANSLQSNGFTISANGAIGLRTDGDGASGGGGGGTIVLNVASYIDAPTITAKGGDGGAVYNDGYTNRCKGEGGGGGGGAIYFSGAVQGTPSVVSGAAGELILSPGCVEQREEATKGADGGIYPNYSYRQSETLNACPGWSSLPINLLLFKVSHKGANTISEWKVGNPEDAFEYILQRRSSNGNWQNIYTIPGDRNTSYFQKGDGPLAAGIYFYRLRIIEKSRAIVYSPIQQVTIRSEDINRLVIYPNPAKQIVNISRPSTGANELLIYDTGSKLVYQKKITGNDPTIKQDISFLAEGVYMIQVGKYTARFVVFK